MTGRGFCSALVVVCLLGFAGCDRSAPVARPPTPPAATAPATSAPATTTAAISVINVNGHATVFPAARLRLEQQDDRVIALLFSDDPRDALKDNYTGNSFYLRMELDITDPKEIARSEWHYQAPSAAQREDSPYGIYLTGRKVQLQPFDVRARFKLSGAGTTVLISGQFEVIGEAGDRRDPQVIPVAAELATSAERAAAASP